MIHNNYDELFTIINSLFVAFKDLILGLFGGAINYLYYIAHHRRKEVKIVFSTAQLVINMVIGAFVGYTVAKFLPPDVWGHDGLVAFSGAMSLKILEMSEGKIVDNILEVLLKGK